MDSSVDNLVGGDCDGEELAGEVETGLIVEDHSSPCSVVTLHSESVGITGIVTWGNL